MKKTVGIITIHDALNCGNRLQNYAVQTVLRRMGLDAVSYIFHDCLLNRGQKIRFLVHRMTEFRFSGTKTYWKEQFPLILKSEKFDRKYIRAEIIETLEDITGKDFYVIGSDQVWNPLWYNDMTKHMFLLDFAEPAKRVCFAPSFGIEQLPEEWKPWFRDNLKEYPMLSVREEAGARIIRELTGRDAQVLIDPTLMLDKEDWRKISHKPRGAGKGYVLTYFLSEPNEAAAEMLAEFQKGKNVYKIMDPEDPIAGKAGPSEFLWLFDHADLILTDSFHACVFSFLFDKPFVVFDRNWEGGNMNSRLETLLKKFSLERKYAGSQLDNDIWEHDYTQGYGTLKLEREKTLAFLQNAWNGKPQEGPSAR